MYKRCMGSPALAWRGAQGSQPGSSAPGRGGASSLCGQEPAKRRTAAHHDPSFSAAFRSAQCVRLLSGRAERPMARMAVAAPKVKYLWQGGGRATGRRQRAGVVSRWRRLRDHTSIHLYTEFVCSTTRRGGPGSRAFTSRCPASSVSPAGCARVP